MSRRATSVAAWIVGVVSLAITVASLVLWAVTGGPLGSLSFPDPGIAIAFPLVGALIARAARRTRWAGSCSCRAGRRPHARLGRVRLRRADRPAVAPRGGLGVLGLELGVDGGVRSARHGPAAHLPAGTAAVASVAGRGGSGRDRPGHDHGRGRPGEPDREPVAPRAAPCRIRWGWVGTAASAVQGVAYAVTLALMVVCVVGLIRRYRAARGVLRLQLSWFTYSFAIALAFLILNFMTAGSAHEPAASAAGMLASAGFAFVAVGVGMAVLRYRLYDIGRIVNRTIVYALLTAVLVGLYAVIVVGIGTVLGRRSSPVLIAGATLVVAALAGPARRRIQTLIDRRFYRRRYDAERVLAEFGARLRDEVDVDELRRLLGAHRRADGAARARRGSGFGGWTHERTSGVAAVRNGSGTPARYKGADMATIVTKVRRKDRRAERGSARRRSSRGDAAAAGRAGAAGGARARHRAGRPAPGLPADARPGRSISTSSRSTRPRWSRCARRA